MTQDDRVDLALGTRARAGQAFDTVVGTPAVTAWLGPDRTATRSSGTESVAVVAGGDDDVVVTDPERPRRVVTTTGGRAATWTFEPGPEDTTVVRAAVAGDLGPEADALRERLAIALTVLAAHLDHLPGRLDGTDVHAWGPSRGRTRDSGHERAHARFLAQVGVVVPRRALTVFRGVPPMSGTCLERRPGHHHSSALLLLDSPAPGIAALVTTGSVEPVHEIRATLHGAPEVAERFTAQWSSWLASA